jgi:hypothetical protein
MFAGVKRGGVVTRVAPVALMPAAAFAVHQLRYWLAFGARAGVELERLGHSYLHSLVPWLVLLIALSLGGFLRALGRALGGQCSGARYTSSFIGLWFLSAVCLVAIYVCQEFLEGLFAIGHPTGLAGVFGYGGWWSIPAAVAVALVLAAAFLGARWVLHEIAQRRTRARGARPAPAMARPRLNVLGPRLAPLADGWSGRGPPR